MGFKSPLFLLGLGSAAETVQAGYRTPLPGWNAGATTAVTQGGYLTPLPFLFGGAGEAIIVDPDLTGGGSSKKLRKHIPGVTGNYSLALREDDELLEMIQGLLSSGYKF